MRPSFLFLFVVALGLLLLAPASIAQTRPGSVHGSVKDSSGGVITGAAVTLAGSEGQVLNVKTDAAGAFVFPKVAAGTYTLTSTYSNMEQASAILISVTNGQVSTNLVMNVKAQKQEVTVEGETTNHVSTEPANNLSAIVLKQDE